MKRPWTAALLFVAIGVAIYAGLAYAAERLMYENGRSNAFFKIATAPARDFDWVILGASHAMPFAFADFNAQIERDTGLRIVNLAAPGTGPLYNRFVLEHFLKQHRTRNLLYVLDSFAFYSRAWNEDRFADAKLLRGTPFDRDIAWRLWTYARRDGVDPRTFLDYVSGFSKLNNRDRFQTDIWEGESQFDRVYRPSASAIKSRIGYLYPNGTQGEALSRYLAAFSGLLMLADQHGIKVTVIKTPVPTAFRAALPNEAAFDTALKQQLAARGILLRDFSAALDEPRYYFDTDHLNRAGATEFLARALKDVLLAPPAQ
jgi:hypothetical protein